MGYREFVASALKKRLSLSLSLSLLYCWLNIISTVIEYYFSLFT
jgi:hypothetical protein